MPNPVMVLGATGFPSDRRKRNIPVQPRVLSRPVLARASHRHFRIESCVAFS